MARSLAWDGQIAPVIVGCLQPDYYAMLDGFKRLWGCQRLGQNFLHAGVIEGSAHVLQACTITYYGYPSETDLDIRWQTAFSFGIITFAIPDMILPI